MRRARLIVAVLVASTMLVAGCSRLTFVRPDAKRKGPQESPRQYEVSDSPATKKRLAMQDRLTLATQRLRSGDIASAEREANVVLKAQPDSVQAHTLLAVVKDQQGDAEAAGRYYRRATELAPQQGEVLSNYGAWLCQHGHAAESLPWFDRALAAPGYESPASALANAGGCALQSGQLERADRDLRKALALDPSNAYALASMARNEFGRGRFFEARAYSERRLAAAPATADVLQMAAQIEQQLGDDAAARRYRQRLAAEFPQAATVNPGGTARP